MSTFEQDVNLPDPETPCRLLVVYAPQGEGEHLETELRGVELSAVFAADGGPMQRDLARMLSGGRPVVSLTGQRDASEWLRDSAGRFQGESVLVVSGDREWVRSLLAAVVATPCSANRDLHVEAGTLALAEVGADGQGVLHLLGWDGDARSLRRRLEEPGGSSCRVILVRHGQAMLVEQGGQVWSHHPVELTPLGLVQAERAAELLRGTRLDAVYSSDLPRALQTAESIARVTGAPLVEEPHLREVAIGDFEGMTIDGLRERGLTEFFPWLDVTFKETFPTDRFHHPADLAFPGGESIGGVARRVWDALGEITRRHRGETVALVSHTWVIQPLIAAAVGTPTADYYRFSLRYATLTLTEWSHGTDSSSLEALNAGMTLKTVAGGRLFDAAGGTSSTYTEVAR